MYRLLAIAMVIEGLGLGPSGRAAAQHDDAGAVTFDQALDLGVRVPAARAPARALEARGQEELGAVGASAQPRVQVMPGYRFSPGPAQGLDLQITVTQSWSLAGLARARRDAATEERAVLLAEARAQSLAHRLEAAHAWIARWTLERRLEVVAEEVAASRALLAAVVAARQVGERTLRDESLARAHAAETTLHAVDLDGVAYEAGLALALERGRTDGRPVGTSGAPPAPELPDPALRAVLEGRVGSLPAVRAEELRALAARARAAEVAVAGSGATATLGASYQRESPGSSIGFLVAGLTVPVFDLSTRAEAAAREAAARADAGAEQLRLEARSELALAQHEVEHTREVERTVREELLPALEEALAQTEALLGVGEATLWQLLDARRQAAEARDRQRTAEGAHVWAVVRAWLLYAEIAR
ncbi:MAG: TolC family protein [Sandaracinaceae bacterium]